MFQPHISAKVTGVTLVGKLVSVWWASGKAPPFLAKFLLTDHVNRLAAELHPWGWRVGREGGR